MTVAKARLVVIEVVEAATDTVVRRLDVTDRTPNARERIEAGANINLDHERYYTRTVETQA